MLSLTFPNFLEAFFLVLNNCRYRSNHIKTQVETRENRLKIGDRYKFGLKYLSKGEPPPPPPPTNACLKSAHAF